MHSTHKRYFLYTKYHNVCECDCVNSDLYFRSVETMRSFCICSMSHTHALIDSLSALTDTQVVLVGRTRLQWSKCEDKTVKNSWDRGEVSHSHSQSKQSRSWPITAERNETKKEWIISFFRFFRCVKAVELQHYDSCFAIISCFSSFFFSNIFYSILSLELLFHSHEARDGDWRSSVCASVRVLHVCVLPCLCVCVCAQSGKWNIW